MLRSRCGNSKPESREAFKDLKSLQSDTPDCKSGVSDCKSGVTKRGRHETCRFPVGAFFDRLGKGNF